MKKIILAVCAAAMALSSCAHPDKIRIRDVEDIRMTSLSRADVVLNVENMSSHKVTLKDVDLTLSHDGEDLVGITLVKEVTLGRHILESVDIPLRLRLATANPFLLMQLYRSELGGFRVNGHFKVKSGWASRKINVEDVSFSEIMTIFGVTEEDFEKTGI